MDTSGGVFSGCPGAAAIKGPQTLKVKTCPVCGGEIELFSGEIKTACRGCGFVAFNDTQSCISWCQYAKECIGEELYEQFMERERQIKAEKERKAGQ